MPHHKSCIKRIKISQTERAYNRHYKSMMKTLIKRVRETQDPQIREELFRKASSIMDKMVNKGIIHRNNAANNKSRLAKMMKPVEPAPQQ